MTCQMSDISGLPLNLVKCSQLLCSRTNSHPKSCPATTARGL